VDSERVSSLSDRGWIYWAEEEDEEPEDGGSEGGVKGM